MSASDQISVDSVVASCLGSDLPLRDQLAAVAKASDRQFPAFAPPVHALIARLEAGEVGQAAPAVGDQMPPFALPDEMGRIVTLHEVLETGPLAIVFHRGHWCPYCRVTAAALARATTRIATAGGRILGILPERQPYAAQLKAASGATYPLLMDIDNGYALSLGLVFWMGEELARLYQADGDAIATYQGNDAWMLPVPATFVVGHDGRIVARFVDPDFRRRMEVDDLVAALQAAR